MKSTVGGVILALLLFAAGAAAWSEAKLTRRVADAHERLATLRYDAGDDLSDATPFWQRLPIDVGSASQDVSRHRAAVSYWGARYKPLIEMTGVTGDVPPSDSTLLFVAANATFRESAPDDIDRKGALERLDRVVQAYGDVLRKDADYVDAAYNYEYVSRVRDALAKAPPVRPGREPRKAPEPPVESSVDLPAGPTLHGRPGGPPEGTDMSDFKTISPMRYDEREEQTDPGRGTTIRRKG